MTASVPVTMLSGFLGVGKTTLLRELLSQSTLKIGCIVNDVAAVNIDAKLVRNQVMQRQDESTADLAPTVELANGCACCSIQDELFLSFEQLLAVSDKRGVPFDRIVLENSGVAEPANLRAAFAEALEQGNPVMQRIHLSTLITVVDSASFVSDFACRNAVATRPDLGGASMLPVVGLLVEQVEVADYVLLNKVDVLGEERVPELTAIVESINPLCQVVSCSHGKVDVMQLFGPDARQLLAKINVEGQHRGYVSTTRKETQAAEQPAHGHGHKHDHACKEEHVHGPECGGGVHAHEHDSKGEHGHSHDHGHACKEDHVHGPDCGHAHAPARDRAETTAKKRFGISSFVYSRRRPFHPFRLKDMVKRSMPARQTSGEFVPLDAASPMKNVLRSKGFVWLSSGHATAYYWSHAGQHFEVVEEGEWWAAVPEDGWPTDKASQDVVLSDFLPGGLFGDRRQEIVFIGTNMDEAAISALLDTVLLTDDELEKYNANWASLPDPKNPRAP